MNGDAYEPVARLIAVVRRRHRTIEWCRAIVRGALSASAVIGLALAAVAVASASARSPVVLAVVGALALLAVVGAIVWALVPLRRRPSDRRLARLVEDRVPALDDRIATAVDVVSSDAWKHTRLLAEPLIRDAARRADAVDVDAVVAPAQLRRSGTGAAAAIVTLLVFMVMAKEPARRSLDAASLTLFPAHVTLDVTPGDARVKEGASVSVGARLVGNAAPVAAELAVERAGNRQTLAMAALGDGRFTATIPTVRADFTYSVVAGGVASPSYHVHVVSPPRVARIDVDYTYPAALGLAPRRETDGGDVYAPSGTDVRLHVHTARPVARGALALSNGTTVELTRSAATELSATMKVTADGSYRVSLVDPDGVGNDGGEEFFIRAVEDRPPEVHIVKPAGDRQVTPLEEVDVEAQADDNYGLERVELVYAVRGDADRVVPLPIEERATTATVRHTIFLEDLGVKPGDFVSYYVRARDFTRSARSNEGRSDIFVLEVRPFEQEFSLAESQSMAGSGYTGSIDDLVNSQKQVVVATWKIDRRAHAATGAQSPSDIRAIGRSESELLTRTEEIASSLRQSTMRDPRSRVFKSADPSLPEEQAMTKAVDAMGRAAAALEALKTRMAVPPEMQALNALLEAQALVKQRQISRQQTAQGGPGNNNRNYDISTLFDRELQRLQETNYESPQTRPGDQDAMADRLKELARRQDELLRRQARLGSLSDEGRRRELETLAREQAQLRQEAEELAKSASRTGSSSDTASRMKDAAHDMEGATNDLRRQDATSGQARGKQALETLQALARERDGARAGEKRDERRGGSGADAANAKLQETLAKARELRAKLDELGRALQRLQESGGKGDRGRLQQEAARRLQETRDLIDQLRREEPSLATGGPGFTYEGQGMTFSAPGTEAFKQDYSRWESLREQATQALDRVSASVSERLDRLDRRQPLASGVADTAPAAYRSRVDDYFKAIAARTPQ